MRPVLIRLTVVGMWTLSVVVPSVGARAAGTATLERGLMRAAHVERGPAIDGTLTSPVWQRCPPLVLGDCTSQKPGPLATTARVLFGPTRLYVAVVCAEPETAGLKQAVADRDGPVWQDDCVELFLTGDPRVGYFHFLVNPRGTFRDARFRPGQREDASWNSAAEVSASVVSNKEWIVTLSVPLKDLAAYVGERQTWLLNVNRTRPARGGLAGALWSWAVMDARDFHEVSDYGQIEGVRVVRRADGVTRVAEALPPPPRYETGTEVGGVTVYRHWDEMTIRDEGGGTLKGISLPIRNSTGLKVAFLARGTGGVTRVPLNLFDARSRDNTTSQAYRWVGPQRQPILYRCDRFVYNTGMTRRVGRAASYRSLTFHGNRTPGRTAVLELRAFTIYRGEDSAPPTAPGGLKADAGDAGVRLSWTSAADNVGVAQYVIARAPAGGAFVKVGEAHEPQFIDRPAAAGDYRYRVLAVDFQDNLGPWSAPVAVKVPRGFDRPPPADLEKDRAGYAAHVRAVHASGIGKVVKGRVLCFGDSLTGATMYRQTVEAALGRYAVEARGYSAQRTGFGRRKIDEDLRAVNPEFCLIMLGTNNSKSPRAIPGAMDDLLAIARRCEKRGTVPVIATIPPRGFTDPASKPEARFNEAIRALCRANRIPIAYAFESLQAGGDRRTLLSGDGVHFIFGGWDVTSRAWRDAVDQVTFVLLDRPD